ncbi:putative lipase ROG1 family protein [Abortiporus biennis]
MSTDDSAVPNGHDTPQPQQDTNSKSSLPQDLLLVIFIHGFKGTDSTFCQFPERLQHILSETISNVVVESVIFPAYETKGELNAAVIRFADWLTNLTVQREVANGVGGGAGKAKIVLCGHSMGGLLAADALIEFVNTRPDPRAPLWPNIIACLAFDTPYFGLHPHVFKNTADQAANYIRTATNLFSTFRKSPPTTTAAPVVPPAKPLPALPSTEQAGTSIWKKWAPAAYAVGGALIAGAAAGTAYYRRDDIGVGYTWATDHMKYVGTLWDEERLMIRVNNLMRIEDEMGVMFRTFYTYIPPTPPSFPSPRTFILLPPQVTKSSAFGSHFLQTRNTLASDEIQAHTGMFDAKGNDGYYELGLLSAQLVRDVIVGLRDKEAVEKEEIQKAEEKRKSVNLTVKVQEDEESSEEEDEDMETPVDANVGPTSPAAVENVEISSLQAVSQSLEDDSLPTPRPVDYDSDSMKTPIAPKATKASA